MADNTCQTVKRERSPNFSERDCLLLTEIMGRPSHFNSGLTYHALMKHKFTQSITSSVKKSIWPSVADAFNAQADINRKPEDLQKKWDNLTQVHRSKYSDFLRNSSATGGGPCSAKISTLTDAVMGVIGKGAVNVVGIVPERQFDTTWFQINSTDPTTSMTDNNLTENSAETSLTDLMVTVTPTQDGTCIKCQCSQCKETRLLKRKKLQYQIDFYKRRINEQ